MASQRLQDDLTLRALQRLPQRHAVQAGRHPDGVRHRRGTVRFDRSAEDLRRKVVDGHCPFRRQQHRPLDDVLQLADVAGPAVRRHRVHRRPIEPVDVPIGRLGRFADEVVDQQRDVTGPLPQRRNDEVDDVDSVEQIFAEPVVGDRGRQIFVGRENDPRVDGPRLGPPDRLESQLLQHP